METDFLSLARGRRREALTARSLLLCDRHERPVHTLLNNMLRRLGF